MFNIKKYIYTAIAIIMLFSPVAKATDNIMPVRVGISDTNFKTYVYNTVEFIDA